MTLLCEFTPAGGELIRCSLVDFSDIHPWDSYIASVSSVKIATPKPWGGYAAPVFSDIAFFPNMFTAASDWPPPENAAVRLRWIADGDETGGTVFFDGTATVEDPEHAAIKYKLKRAENATKVAAATVLSGTLTAVIEVLCGSSYLNLSLDTSRARIPSPAVSWTVDAEKLTTALVDEICQSFSHAAINIGGTLYLIDMYDTSTALADVSDWDVTDPGYKFGSRYSLAKYGNYSVTSSTVANGDELSIPVIHHGTQANIEEAMGIILEIANRPTVELKADIGDDLMTVGGCYLYNDESGFRPLQLIMVAHDVVYNFDSETMLATGPGRVA